MRILLLSCSQTCLFPAFLSGYISRDWRWLAAMFSCSKRERHWEERGSAHVCLCVCGGVRVRCVLGGPVIRSHYCNWKLKSHLFSPLVLTVSTKTGVLLQKLTFGMGVKGQAREHQLSWKGCHSTNWGHSHYLLLRNRFCHTGSSLCSGSSSLFGALISDTFLDFGLYFPPLLVLYWPRLLESL